MNELLEKQSAFFATGKTKNINYRKDSLKKLEKWIRNNSDKILEALEKDLKKSAFEGYASEIKGTLDEISLAIKNIEKWSRPKKVKTPLTFFKAKSKIVYEPFGSVLIISTWNYPFSLGMIPVVGAIAAGNCCVLKPSELSANTSKLLYKAISECFDDEFCAVVEGGAEVAQELLSKKFDFIHYTGGSRVGKIVAKAASENFIPVVLEMGGKSPCIVDNTADIEISARRICWGKFLNAGQTCIAPDYIMAHKSIKDELVKAMQKELLSFYGSDPKQCPDFPRIVSKGHFER